MTRLPILVSFVVVCLFAGFSGQALAGVTSDNLSLNNFKLADSKPYDALAKAFQKTRQQTASSSLTKSSDKKTTSKLSNSSKTNKKHKVYKNKTTKTHKKSFNKKNKTYKKAAYHR